MRRNRLIGPNDRNDFAVERLESRLLLSGAVRAVLPTAAAPPPRGGVITGMLHGDAQLAGLAIQADGKFIAAGYATETGQREVALARYNTDGSLDTTFGTGGIVLTPMGYDPVISSVAIDSSGRIVVAGTRGVQLNPSGEQLWWGALRFNPDGSLDSGFGVNGFAQSVSTVGGQIGAMAITPSGMIDLVGWGNVSGHASSQILVAQLHPDGTLNTSFGTQGFSYSSFGTQGFPVSVALQTDGKIVIGGDPLVSNVVKFGVERLNADGSVDTTFGTSGVSITSLAADGNQLTTIALGSDGTIVAGGFVIPAGGGYTEDAIVRYTANGAVDSTFGNGGLETFNIHFYDGIEALAVTSDGEIITGGESEPQGYGAFTVVKLHADGSFDTTFGTGGYTQTIVGQKGSIIQAMALTSKGGIVVGGNFDATLLGDDNHWALAVYTPKGLPDQTFGVPYDINSDGSVDAADLAILQQNLGQPGTFATGDLNGDGIVDQSDYNLLVQNLSGGIIAGSVFNDTNNSGVQGGDLGLPGATVYLDANDNGQLDPGEYSATTDANGIYRFFNLPPGSYTVRDLPAPGYAFTAALYEPASVVVQAGQWTRSPTFGNVQVSTIPINAAYLAILSNNLGKPGTFATGDLNGDGIVDSQDQLIAQENFGHPIDALIDGSAGNDLISLVQDADGQHVDWTAGSASGQIGLSDSNGMTINGNGGNDSLMLNYQNGDPLPLVLHLNGNFTISGFQGLDGSTLDIGKSTIYFAYSPPDPLSLIQRFLSNGFNNGAWNGAAAIARPINALGYNQDVIVEAGAANAQAGTTTTFDGNYVWYENGFPGSGTTGLPPNGSTFFSAANPDVQFALQPYTSNNVALIPGGNGSVMLSLVNPSRYTAVSFLAAAANGSASLNATLSFADSTAVSIPLMVSDWFRGANAAFIVGGRIVRATGATVSLTSNNPRLYEYDYVIPAADQNKTLQSVTFSETAGNQVGIFGLSGFAAFPGPSSPPRLP